MNIAVIRFSSLGDVVLATAILQKLIEAYPDCRIDFITERRFAVLFSTDTRIRSVVPYDVTKESPGYMIGFLRKIRRERYDLVIDAHLNPRSVIVSSLARTRNRRRVKKYSWQRRLMVRRHKVWEIPHVVQRYLASVDGVEDESPKPMLHVGNSEGDTVRREIKGRCGERSIVGIALGAAKRTKVWDVEKAQELALALTVKHGFFLIFFGNKKDVQLVDTICKPLKDGYLNLAGKTNLRELALNLKVCDVALTSDSGPMHVAVAVDTPVVALFGPTVREFGFRPCDEQSVIISVDLPCRPCSLHGTKTCFLGHHRCMKAIAVETVEEAIVALLGSKSKE